MSWGWFFAWQWKNYVLRKLVLPDSSIRWCALWIVAFVLLRLKIHPECSLGAMVAWSFVFLILNTTILGIYLLYRYHPDPHGFLRWGSRSCRQRWHPVAKQQDRSYLCDQCKLFTTNSKLIMGSRDFLTRLVEWHEFGDSLVVLRSSAQRPDRPCHLCALLWYSLSDKQREAGNYHHRLPVSSVQYKVKVWEERPLSPYTFAQLYNGDTALSARLLIHRGVLFEAPSMASVVPSTESDRHIEQANAWLKNCSSSHLLCNGVGNAPLELPTRIVKVTANSVLESRDSHPVIRLELVDPGDYGIKYLALSHCWGTSNTFILTLSNYESCLNDINFCSLSKNMQHAVEITQRLGFSYLWIDSLCIIQDSKEDWVKESARMGSVYSGAFCTIASTGSSSGDGGCFHERNCLSLRPCRIGVSSPKALLPNWIWARRDDILDFERSIDISPLNKRAWVLQERLLSRRILHFGAEMMYWECCQRSASELSPNGYIYKKYPEDESSSQTVTEKIDPSTDFLNLNAKWGSALTWWTGKRIFHQLKAPPDAFDPDDPQINYKIWQYKRAMWKKIRKPSPQPWTEDSANVEGSGFRHSFETLRNNNFAANIVGTNSFSRHWYELVEPYSRGNLTQRKDKLVAISGIVKEIQRATGYTYVAGLWKEHVLTDMLWLTPEGPGRRRATGSAGSMDYIAPTWSWASLNAVIGHDLLPDNSRWDLTLRESLVTISDPLVTPSELGPNGEFGAVKDGSLNMEGHLCQVRVGMEGKAWFLKTDTCSRLARLFPDEAPPDPPNFYCMPFLRLKRQTNVFVQEEEVQGLVLTPCRRMVDLLPVYQRVGFFTTGRMLKGPESMKELMGAPVKIVKVI